MREKGAGFFFLDWWVITLNYHDGALTLLNARVFAFLRPLRWDGSRRDREGCRASIACPLLSILERVHTCNPDHSLIPSSVRLARCGDAKARVRPQFVQGPPEHQCTQCKSRASVVGAGDKRLAAPARVCLQAYR